MSRSYCVASVLPKAAIDDVMLAEPASVVPLFSKLREILNLQPKTTWKEIAKRARSEFVTEQGIADFLYADVPESHLDNGVSWKDYQLLMQYLNVSTTDLKLLWLELKHNPDGELDWEDFVQKLHDSGFYDTQEEVQPERTTSMISAHKGKKPTLTPRLRSHSAHPVEGSAMAWRGSALSAPTSSARLSTFSGEDAHFASRRSSGVSTSGRSARFHQRLVAPQKQLLGVPTPHVLSPTSSHGTASFAASGPQDSDNQDNAVQVQDSTRQWRQFDSRIEGLEDKLDFILARLGGRDEGIEHCVSSPQVLLDRAATMA
jgi:hypothetical protein